jgi:hypothetical protein
LRVLYRATDKTAYRAWREGPCRGKNAGAVTLLLLPLAANAVGRFLAFDLGKQPHRENHEAAEERHDILKAVVAKDMLEPGGDSRNQDDDEWKPDLDFGWHRSILPLLHDMLAKGEPEIFASAASVSIW